jgi:hypothetical protein
MNLSHRQEKIQAKRKQTPWRAFVMEICSWQNFVLKKDNGLISKYSNKERAGNIVPLDVFQKEDCSYYAFDSSLSNNFMEKFIELFGIIPKAALMHF